MTQTLEQRFWNKVQKTDGCWLWTGSQDKKGRGKIKINRRVEMAYRVAHVLTHGGDLDGLKLRHTCGNPACVRPDHLALPIISTVCQHCHFPRCWISQYTGLCMRCHRYWLTRNHLPPRRFHYEHCPSCKRPRAPGVRFITRLCQACYQYKWVYKQDRPKHLIQKLAPHGWCDCGRPAVEVRTLRFGKQAETFALCQECAA